MKNNKNKDENKNGKSLDNKKMSEVSGGINNTLNSPFTGTDWGKQSSPNVRTENAYTNPKPFETHGPLFDPDDLVDHTDPRSTIVKYGGPNFSKK